MNRKEEIQIEIWDRLVLASHSRHDPFHHLVLATVEGNRPRARTVILRNANSEDATLRFHIDRRSPKFHQMSANDKVEILGYSESDKLQIRLSGQITLHTNDEIADEAWQRAALLSRRCYCQELPQGTPVNEPSSSLPFHLQHREPTEIESSIGRSNFSVILAHIQEIDWYSLAFTGHQRLLLHKSGDTWERTWAIP